MQVFSRYLALFLILGAGTASLPAFSTGAEPIYYSDCAYIEFEDIDNAQMTREEQLAAMDADFEESLNASEECMSEALDSGAQKLADAGAGSDTGDQESESTESADNSVAAQASSATEYQTTQSQQQHTTTDQTRSHAGGQGQQGSSAVCDAVRQGLESATTDSEKAHFQSLMNEYGCS